MSKNVKQEILDTREHNFYDSEKLEALSLAIVTIASAVNIENVPDIETTLALHALIFGFVKEIGKIVDYSKHNAQEDDDDKKVEYSKVELGTAVLRSVVAPFLIAATVSNFESIDQTIHLTENLDNILLSIGAITGVLAGIAGIGVLIKKSGDGLANIYRWAATNIGRKKDEVITGASEWIKSVEPQNPIRDVKLPLKKVEFQWPAGFQLPWKKRNQQGEAILDEE
ncbi:MAG: hypothetical protein OEX81_04500 [Candidatus Pacebacteria bacterium]|nr:hypothetical protein [Candidatus Paceibacterota bacterium]